MKIQALILSAALVIPMTVAAQSKNQSNKSNNQGNNSTTVKKSSKLTKQDHMFLHKLACEDHAEIKLAKLALQKSKDGQIQKYAKSKILSADPSMEQQAKQIAKQSKTPISSKLNQASKQEYKDLSNLPGKQFDKAYVNHESRKQANDLKVVEYEAANANNPKVRSFAKKQEKPVKQAAQAAQHMALAMHVSSAG